MEPSVQEQVLLDLLKRAKDDYRALERCEGAGTDEDRSNFDNGIAIAMDVLRSRILRRIEQ